MVIRAGVVAFAWGVPSTLWSNRQIAAMASGKSFGSIGIGPVYTQRDVIPAAGIPVAYTEEKIGEPPPTLRIARGAVRWAVASGLNELWIACALPHLRRCKRDLEYAIREADAHILVRVCDGVNAHPEDAWYMPESTQPRVRTREEWRKRESILECLPMFIYKRVAS